MRSVNDFRGGQLAILPTCINDSILFDLTEASEINKLTVLLNRLEMGFGAGKIFVLKEKNWTKYFIKNNCYIYIYNFPSETQDFDTLFFQAPYDLDDYF